MAALLSKCFTLNECIEQAAFKTIIIICLVGCVSVIPLDLLLVKGFNQHIYFNILATELLLVILYALNKIDFAKITTIGLLALAILLTARGLTTNDYNEITYTLLITVGFISSLVSRTKTGVMLKTIVLICLIIALFKDYNTVGMVILLRKGVPYLFIFSIVTICSGILKSKYEDNQVRLRELIELLNNKNKKIKEQHTLLKKNYRELNELNENLASTITQKTQKIAEKNKHLAAIVYANAHTIRGPLARILGLLNLAALEPENRDLYYCKISHEAVDMDKTLTTVTKQIEMNIHQ
jgi:signal transduction histidine kinase